MWWLVAGLAGGLALDSKYTALFLWVRVGLWFCWCRRPAPSHWQPWAACLIGLASFAPVLWWNAAHGGASFAKQSAASTIGARLGRLAFSPNWLAVKSV
jgi:hypothetical protein